MRHQARILCIFTAAAGWLTLLPSCKKETPAVSPPETATGTTSVSQLSESDRKAIMDMGDRFVEALKKKDMPAIRVMINPANLMEGIFEGVNAPESFREGFKKGMAKGLEKSYEQWLTPNARVKGLVICDGKPAVRIRISNGGLAFVDFEMAKRDGSNWKCVDYFNHAANIDFVLSTRQMVAPILAEYDRSIVERLTGVHHMTKEDEKQIFNYFGMVSKNDFAGIKKQFLTLPASFQANKAVYQSYLGALHNAHDDEAYKAALKNTDKLFPDNSFGFMLVDVYFMDKEYKEAIDCVDRLSSVVGEDAELLCLKASFQHLAGDDHAAAASLERAIALEQDSVTARVEGLDVFLAMKDFPRVRDSIAFLETHESAKYHFKGKLAGPIWADFVKSPESVQWR